jgi:oxygen-independent coproporphyrinogen-3 oxidase
MAGIYVHIPFCKQACNYCDFHFSTKLANKTEVLAAMEVELEQRKDFLKGEEIRTIYFGGGTPSILSEGELARIVNRIQNTFKLSSDYEFTLEVNPDDISLDKLKSWRALGINRLSMGVQSFKESDLTFMNRAHNSTEAIVGLRLARSIFSNISIDLIYGVPGMSLEDWDSNISEVIAMDIPHVSAYALTVEPNTKLANQIAKGKCQPVDEDMAAVHFDHLVSRLDQANFEHYEISNFAKSHFRSEHNSSYWLGETYLGIGPAAHSYKDNIRSWNISNNTKYTKALTKGENYRETEMLSVQEQYNEFIMISLRTIEGISELNLINRFGVSVFERFKSDIADFILQGDIMIKEGYYRLNTAARFRADGIASDLFWID